MLQRHLDMLKEDLIKVIPVVEYHQQHEHPDWSGQEADKVECPLAASRHEAGDDSTASLSINPDSGAFKCFGCGWKGTSVVGYATDVHFGSNFSRCIGSLFAKYIRPTIKKEEILNYHGELTRRSKLIQRILSIRGWTLATMIKLRIGWSSADKRTVLPIYNLAGMCVDLKFHDTIRKAARNHAGKRMSLVGMAQGTKTGDWYPVSPEINPWAVDNDTIYVVEGEPDAVMAFQEGLNVVTLTGGASVWAGIDHARLTGFKGKHVILCMDNDKAGQQAAKDFAGRLTAVGIASLKNIRVPEGKDFTDWVLRYSGSGTQLKQIASASGYKMKPKQINVSVIPLCDTSKAEHVGKSIKTDVLVNGKHHSPQAIPAELMFSCTAEDRCERCPCRDNGREDYFVDAEDPEILEWLYCRDYGKQIRKEMGLPSRCQMRVEVTKYQGLESVSVIPALSTHSSEDESVYVTRNAYALGHGVEANQTYSINAMPVVHPRTKESVLIIRSLTGTYDSISGFELTDEEIEAMHTMFSDPPMQIIKDVCEMLAANYTHIYRRWDLHAAVDLTFHCPRDFSFAGVSLPKGSIELLLFGDTRCGKGQVAEGLVSFYDLGTVVSGENSSLMGLSGGALKDGDSFRVVWGAIPINNGRLVVIDEFSGLGSDVLGKLSRIRSEGIAELNKGGINAKTKANARLIWIANPKKGRPMMSFANGISAISDLVEANEDIARFDLAVVVQQGEVDIMDINARVHPTIDTQYDRATLRKLVLWVWSRNPEQILFTREATESILHNATALSTRYSPTIPLIQGENARLKLAKIAAAIAGRCFSSPDGVFLKVTVEHAELAASLICHFYDKPSMGYLQFSEVEASANVLRNREELNRFFQQWGEDQRRLLVEGMIEHEKFGVREMQDWVNVDGNIAKRFCGMLVRCHAIQQQVGGFYKKRPAFIKYLKKMKRRLDQ